MTATATAKTATRRRSSSARNRLNRPSSHTPNVLRGSPFDILEAKPAASDLSRPDPISPSLRLPKRCATQADFPLLGQAG